MKFACGNRASSVLFNWLKSNNIKGRALIPANICESVPATYLKSGMEVVFCDIDLKTFQPDYFTIKEVLSGYSDIALFHFNHTYGCRREIDNKVLTCLKKYNPKIILVDDCCLSVPKLNNAESEFDLELFSTGHTKVVNVGKGGFAFYQEQWNYKEFDEKFFQLDVETFDNHVKSCHVNGTRINTDIMKSHWMDTIFRYDEKEYLAEVNRKYSESIEHKKLLNKIYDNYLSDFSLGDDYQDWRYNILVDNPDYCLRQLFDHGLFASKHYKSLGSGYFVSNTYHNCDWLENHVINLFNDFCYTEEQAERTAKLLKSIARPLNIVEGGNEINFYSWRK